MVWKSIEPPLVVPMQPLLVRQRRACVLLGDLTDRDIELLAERGRLRRVKVGRAWFVRLEDVVKIADYGAPELDEEPDDASPRGIA